MSLIEKEVNEEPRVLALSQTIDEDDLDLNTIEPSLDGPLEVTPELRDIIIDKISIDENIKEMLEELNKKVSPEDLQAINDISDALSNDLENNLFYPTLDKARDLHELGQNPRSTELRVYLDKDYSGIPYLTVEKDNIPKSATELLDKVIVRPDGTSGYLVTSPSKELLESLDSQLAELRQKYPSAAIISKDYINRIYERDNCTKKDLVNLCLSRDFDRDKLTKTILNNKLISTELISKVASGYGNYILTTKFKKEYDSIVLKENQLAALKTDPKNNALKIDKLLVDLRQEKKDITKMVNSYVTGQLYSVLQIYYSKVLKNQDLYDGPKPLKFLEKVRARIALAVSFVKKDITLTTDYNKEIKWELRIIKLLSPFLTSNLADKITKSIDEILKSSTIMKYLEKKWKPFLLDKIFDKLKSLKNLSLDGVVDLISSNKGNLSRDPEVRASVFESGAKTTEYLKSRIIKDVTPDITPVFSRDLPEQDAFNIFISLITSILDNQVYLEETILSKNSKGNDILSDERGMEIAFIDKKCSVLLQRTYSKSKAEFYRNVDFVNKAYIENLEDKDYTNSAFANDLLKSMDKYETIVQLLEYYPAVVEEFRKELEARSEGREYEKRQFTGPEAEALRMVDGASSWIKNEQLFLSSMELSKDLLEAMPKIFASISTPLAPITSFAIPFIIIDTIKKSRFLNSVSAEFDMLRDSMVSSVNGVGLIEL